MDKYKIIVVDDEEEIREGIIRKIQWEKYGFVVVGSGENGKEALELVEKIQPDVVMTDVMMPFMDGLELCEEISKIMPDTKLIIFSGSDDLEYAHKAIKMNVIEYVLKPVNSADMEEVLTKLKKRLDDEYESKRNVETLRQYYMDSLPVIREQFLVSLIEGRTTAEEFRRNCAMAGLDIDSNGFVVAFIKIENKMENETKSQIFKNHDDALIPITVKKIVDETICKYFSFSSFLYGEIISFIINVYEDNKMNVIIKAINEVCKEAKKIYGLTVSGGISLQYKNMWEIPYARKEAQSALDYRLVLGMGKAIYIGDVEPDTTKSIQFYGQDEYNIVTAIKMGNEEEIMLKVQEAFDKLHNIVLPLSEYRIYFMEIMTTFLQLIQTYKLDYKEVFGEKFLHGDPFEQIKSLNHLKEWVMESCFKISQYIKKERVDSSGLLVNSAKQYVEENYSDSEITVERLSKILHVSSTYFSTIFKRETGTSFVAYLTDVRLNMAVKLLNTTDYKSYIIAEKVGYCEPNYFSYVFKKKFGVSPSKYKNS